MSRPILVIVAALVAGLAVVGGASSAQVATPNHTKARTAVRSLAVDPSWTNLALGKSVSASNEYPGNPASLAVDGDWWSYWSSGGYPPQWIEVDLGSVQTVGEIDLGVTQLPDSFTVHSVYGRADASQPYTLLHEFDGYTVDQQLLQYVFSTPQPLRYIRIETTQSASWVGWREIEVWGPSPAPPVGSHDAASGLAKLGGCVADGWAQDPDAPTTHLTVRVLVDGTVVATTVADRFRQDLLDAGIGDGTFSFAIDLAGLLSADTEHQIRAQAQDTQTGQWVDLGGTPKSLTCTQLTGTHDGNAGIQQKPSCIAGGWAWDADSPTTRLEVRVKVDGKVVAETTANAYRDDVRAAGFGDGYSGWTIDLFGRVTPGVAHLITAEERDATLKRVWLPLYNTNIYLTCTPS
jgi:F5/8 type C domain